MALEEEAMLRLRIIAAAAMWLCSVGIAAAAPAPPDTFAIQGGVIDRVVATVEDRAILKSDIDAELARILMQTKRTEVPREQEQSIREEILQGLIGEALLVIQAERENITVEDRDVDQRVEQIIEENKTTLGGDEAFNRQLAAEGLTLETLKSIYREKVRSRMLIERLYQKIGTDVRITERDVREYYNEHVAELPKRPPTVSLAHILIVPKPSRAVLEKARERITEIAEHLRKGEDFAALATEMSDCPSAKFGGSLGAIRLEDLNSPAFEDAAAALAPGDVSAPVLTEFGYHIIKVEAVDGDRVTLRHILARAEASPEDLAEAEKLAERVRDEILAGADFAEVAAERSDDAATKNAGGFIGEVPIDNLPEQVRETIRGVPAGGVAPVFKDDKGYRILKILGWNEERAYTYEEAKEELRRYIAEQKGQERLGGYVEELKKIYSVQIRGGA
jgi:peptidyl-prolyl cis-trans isomerase SurA